MKVKELRAILDMYNDNADVIIRDMTSQINEDLQVFNIVVDWMHQRILLQVDNDNEIFSQTDINKILG